VLAAAAALNHSDASSVMTSVQTFTIVGDCSHEDELEEVVEKRDSVGQKRRRMFTVLQHGLAT
jgi:hypothetical protein